jgi:hypothetical protein
VGEALGDSGDSEAGPNRERVLGGVAGPTMRLGLQPTRMGFAV